MPTAKTAKAAKAAGERPALPGMNIKRWCRDCSLDQVEPKGSVMRELSKTMCEDCHELVKPNWGVKMADGSIFLRWCVTCANDHGDAVRKVARKKHAKLKCEDCDLAADYGVPEKRGPAVSGKIGKERRWCKACSLSHMGAINLNFGSQKLKKCEDCGKQPKSQGSIAWGMPEGPGGRMKRRWCISCAQVMMASLVPPYSLHKAY
jgi:hypothetical protein